MKKLLLIILIMLFLVGCGSYKSINNAVNTIEETTDSTEFNKYNDEIVANNTNEILESTIDEQDIITEQDIIDEQDIIADKSQIKIKNILQNGTFWAIETNDMGEEYIIHADIFGNVMDRLLCNEFMGIMEYGINDTLVIIKVKDENDQYHIMNIQTNEDITNEYVGDFDEICEFIETNNEIVLVIRKTVESFDENYECYKLVDNLGNEMFEISLDKDTLLNEYGIEKMVYSKEEIQIEWFINNIFYIPYLGSKYDDQNLNSLIIDLDRNKVFPAAFPYRNGLYCSSDGNYTVVYTPSHGAIIVNNDTGEFEDFPNRDYDPVGELSEGKIMAVGHWNGNSDEQVVLDVQGNILINLNDYGKLVSRMYPFIAGVALIEFGNDYVTFIDSNGRFLFEPVKGNVRHFYSKQCIAVVKNRDSGDIYSIDKNGNIQTLELSGENNIFYVEYEGSSYWIEGGKEGLQVVETN